MPTLFLLGVMWTFSLIVFGSALTGLMSHSAYSAIFAGVLLATVALIGYLIFYTSHYINDMTSQYEFELSDREMRLRIDDRVSGRRLFAHMPYGEIDFVEHYTPRDNATLVFHGTDSQIVEVPIWSMTEDTDAIIDFLTKNRINIVRL